MKININKNLNIFISKHFANEINMFFGFIFRSSEFRSKIIGKNFDYSTISGLEALLEVKNNRPAFIELVGYKSFWPWSKCNAYVKASRPDTIFINTRKLKNMNRSKFMDLIMHELVHICDSYSEHSFGHGNNSSVGKENSVPYFFGNLAGKISGRINQNGIRNIK